MKVPAHPEAEAFRGGADAAFAAVWTRYHPRLVARAIARTADPDLAEDLVQEMWARAYARRRLYSGHGPLLAWLLRVLDRVAVTHARREQRRARLLAEHAYDVPLATTEEASEASRDMVTPDHPLVSEALRVFGELPPLTRRIAERHWLHGEPPREIARRLDIEPSTVWTRLSHVRRELRRIAIDTE